ncbi:MAG: class II aldolase/adducin family protein [Proteobacteria bacterium]|nr:class II aldolase/adducin family protein [Pseudomonadota bacterium]
MPNPNELIVEIGRRMAGRWSANTAGGNISLREGDKIYISPRYADYKWGWQLQSEQIVSGPIEGDALLDHPNFSREGRAHLAIYRAFPEAQAVIHAHPFHVMPFAAAAKPIKPIIDAATIFGTIEPVPYASPNSQELADNIVAGLRGKEKLIASFAAPVVMPKHGVIIAGKDIYAALETLVKIDMNAWCVLAQKLL